MWPVIVRSIGGVHMFGPLWVLIVDTGVVVAWRQRVVWEVR